MSTSSDPIRLTIVYERDEGGWTKATVAGMPGVITAGRNRREARANVLDAFREMLAAPVELPDGASREEVGLTFNLERRLGRDHGR